MATIPRSLSFRRPRSRPRFALALAGGGVIGGMYEVGVLTALEQRLGTMGRIFDVYVGCSAGSVVGSLIASGIPAREIFRILDEDVTDPLNFRRNAVFASDAFRRACGRFGQLVWAFGKNVLHGIRGSVPDMLARAERDMPPGFFSLAALEMFMRTALASRSLGNAFADLPCTLLIPAVDLDRAERVVFGLGDLRDVPISQAVAASSAIPGFFDPYSIDGRDYIDGGVGFTGHADLAAETGADVVVVVNPLVPTLLEGRVASIRSRGLYTIMEQAGRIYSQNLLDLGLSVLAARFPRTTFVLHQPPGPARSSSAPAWASRRRGPRSATASPRVRPGSTRRACRSCGSWRPRGQLDSLRDKTGQWTTRPSGGAGGPAMIFQQFLNEDSGCLSYLIGCGTAGQAIVVDPGRDRVNEYLRCASKKGMKMTRVIETHTHADHISGARDLRAACGADILVHLASGAVFDHGSLRDGEELTVGQVRLRVLHTPGHTPDSLSVLVTDLERGPEPWFVLTGDTLFVGSVGRPDLGGASAAGDIYDSLTRVLLPLDDLVEVYPAHGSGSSCGKAMSAKSGSTIGFERRFNPALRLPDRDAFIEYIMTGVPPKPAAFETIVAKNRGVLPLHSAKPRPYGAREAWEAIQAGAVVLDLRDPATYGEGHVRGAINVWIDSPQFAERVAGFVRPGSQFLLMAQGPSDLDQAVQALTRVGIDEIAGFLQWGMIEWKSEGLPTETVPQITVWELASWRTERPELVLIDVREPSEWVAGHVDGAVHLPMFEAVKRLAEVPADRPKAVMCAGGLRSSTVISALKQAGLSDFYNVTGGMSAWLRAGYGMTKA